MGTATPIEVGDYSLVEFEGLWFLDDRDDRTVSTILDIGNGLWRARTPQGHAETFSIPDDVMDPALYVAKQLVMPVQGRAAAGREPAPPSHPPRVRQGPIPWPTTP